jgi:hypothetical protein
VDSPARRASGRAAYSYLYRKDEGYHERLIGLHHDDFRSGHADTDATSTFTYDSNATWRASTTAEATIRRRGFS